MIRVGVDTGGTFTDFIYEKDGRWYILKLPSTPQNPAKAVLNGLEKIGEKFYDITHGSTVATNAVLERKGAKTAFITNKGFEDILYIGRQNRKELYNLFYKRPSPLIPDDLRFGLDCRVNHKGEILKDLDEKDIDKLIDRLKEKRIEAVAVSLLFSFLNPEHEKIIKEKLISNGFYTSVSHEISPEFREYERSSTVALNSYVMPKMVNYISTIEEKLKGNRFRIIQSNGGVISPETAKKEPIRTVLSGPAGGVVGAYNVGKKIGRNRLITFDMGGTSTDVSLIDGSIPFSTQSEISGFPVRIPMIEIHTVGAGGGSVAYIDEGGALNVGPESAGADPGPVCYGKGERLTVTDANLFLGRIVPEYFLGGNMKLDINRVSRFFKKYSELWRIDPVKLAEGILFVANTKMEKAVKMISVEKGYNPKDFSLFSFGGAGGLHAAFLARSLSIKEVILPKDPGIFSAFGMMLADVVKDYALTVMVKLREGAFEHINGLFSVLEEKAVSDIKREGFEGRVKVEKFVDMRYEGQSYEIVIPFSKNLVKDFHKAHKKIYGYMFESRNIEVVNIRLRLSISTKKPPFKTIDEGEKKPPAEALFLKREIVFEGKQIKTDVFLREKLLAGNVIKGPAVVVEYSSTTVIPPDTQAEIDKYGNIIIKTC